MSDNCFAQYCIRGLKKIYVPSERVFAAFYRLSNGQMVHVRDRFREYRFTMNALMALHQARAHGNEIFLDVESDYRALLTRVDERTGSLDLAATLWTGRSLGTEIPPYVTALFRTIVSNAPTANRLSAKALGWLITACLSGDEEYRGSAVALGKLALGRYLHPKSSLVREIPTGPRRLWASFSAHSYVAYALLLLARKTGEGWARDAGLRIARALVRLQAPQGLWGYMYHVPTGRVVDYYPAYSVHQDAYAPFFLTEAIDQGFAEFKEPLLRGFRWVLGQNELGHCMVEPRYQVVWRSIIRKEPNATIVKALRRVLSTYVGGQSRPKAPDSLKIDRQCWSFEMALPLYVFSGRTDLPEILDAAPFSSN